MPNQYRNSSNKTFAYISYELDVNGTPVTVKLDIKKSPNKNKLWVHSIIMEKNSIGLDVYSNNETVTPSRTDADVSTTTDKADDHTVSTQNSGVRHNLSSANTDDRTVDAQNERTLPNYRRQEEVYHKSNNLSSESLKDINPVGGHFYKERIKLLN